MVSLGGVCRSHSPPRPWLGLVPLFLTLEPGLFLLGFPSTSARKEDPVFLSGMSEVTLRTSHLLVSYRDRALGPESKSLDLNPRPSIRHQTSHLTSQDFIDSPVKEVFQSR